MSDVLGVFEKMENNLQKNTIDAAVPPTPTFPPVLDACCGSRMFWFDKRDERAIYADRRTGTKNMDVGTPSTKGRTPVVIAPDVLQDFTEMQFGDDTFFHVVFDPPHLETVGDTGFIAFKYGRLTDGWREMIRLGFSECFRVLKPGGTLIFKWCETDIPLRDVLALTPEKPLYGHRSGKKAQTHWVAFMKTPNAALTERGEKQ